jgi:hypothetical protein
VRPSRASVGDCFDNARCESFLATLEGELLDRRRFKTQSEARIAIFEFIEGWYNPRRRHSALDICRQSERSHSKDTGYRSPTPSIETVTPDWPQMFGVVVASDLIHPPNFDLAVVYNPPGGAAGIRSQVMLEKFINLSLNPADPNYVVTQINGVSKLIEIPASYAPPAGPLGGFPAAPTMLANTGVVNLNDLSSPAITYLVVEAVNPSTWPPLFGVRSQPNAQDPTRFDLAVEYDSPSGGVGVPLPVTVESFTDLSLRTPPLSSIRIRR